MRSKISPKLMMRWAYHHPNFIIPISRGLLRKHLTVNQDYKNADGKAIKPPMQISLRITNICNHRCAVCGQYGKHGYMNNKENKELLKNLPLDTYKKLVDEVAFYKPLFYLTGGEPFLYPEIMELMKYIKEKGCIATIVTNGVLLEKYAEQIVKDKWDQILVSFDGPKEIHDACRNVKGAYDTAINGLLKLKQARIKYNSKKPFIMTSTTISKVNAPVLEQTFEIGKQIMPDMMVVYLSWFTSEEIGNKQTELFEKELGITPFTWKSYVTRFNKEDAEIFEKKILEIKKKKWPFDYIIIPDIKNKDISKYYLETDNTFGYNKCAAPFFMVDIMPNGDVVTCRDFIDVKVGNITEEPLLKIWNNEKYKKFRKLLIKNKGLLPQCSRCCGLMGY